MSEETVMRRNRIKVPFQVLRYPAQPWSPRALSWPLTDPCRTLVVDPSLAVRLPPAHPGSSLENTTAPHPPTGPHHSPQHPPLPGGCPCVLVLCSLSPARRSRPSQRLRQTGPPCLTLTLILDLALTLSSFPRAPAPVARLSPFFSRSLASSPPLLPTQ